MRVGIFGGTFDPPHMAHLILAAEAGHQLDLRRVLWVLTSVPPHKPDRHITPLEIRLRMLQAALEDQSNFVLSRVDMDRPPPHYAMETVKLLREEYPKSELIYLMGGDSLVELPTWYAPGEFLAACDGIGVLKRSEETIDMDLLDEKISGLSLKVNFIHAPLVAISSSEIRRRIRHNEPYRYFLPENVYRFIEENGLYRHEI
jgi:nicotinate-nucleotide adenylyltransferase